ncbi:TonB-dependent receptor plug domain-containing protein [Sandaracinobacteroides hominis]|uniref:TonB-dependent receptor plug domain-containing protein n=1 Tax=Sandaracinobacteroides hominis TaxID=2780086 RepID=UPI0018F4906A|nr:TonB-dependent receptor [Sandaracinobacteroides hominis]
MLGLTALAGTAAQAQEARAEEETLDIIVQATRSGRGVDDEAIRVDVIEREEIEEKILMTPGNVSMLVAETPGVRVQVTSPSLGSSNVRMQGMDGRYTQLLADGLPLYGGQASSAGLLQIPPTDLGQVEVIKGSVSALYGASALGGVINFVSRRPGDASELEALLNLTSRGGQDLTAYAATPAGESVGLSLTGGFHRQDENDLDGDGWADMPGYQRWTIRPRLFVEGANGGKLFVTLGAMTEDRTGGTLAGRTAPDGQPFVEALDTTRLDAGLVGETPISDTVTLHLRASAMLQDHRHQFGDVVEDDRHETSFGEVSVVGDLGGASWLAGVALQHDGYHSKQFASFDYDYVVPGIFGQLEGEVAENLTLAGSARLDRHSEYGTYFSPRVSALYKPGPWTIRASWGRGFYAPTPFVEQIEAAGLSRLEPLDGLKAEQAGTASLDIGYRAGGFTANLTLFASDIENAVQVRTVGPQSVRLVNADGTTRTRGAEVMLRYRWDAFTVTGNYVRVNASEPDPDSGNRRTVPRTPRDTAGLVAMWEEHGQGRIGIEAYYTGKQELEDNPWRSRSKPYVELGALAEVVLGRVRLFINAENILNVRQTNYDPLVRPTRAPDGRWTVDVWAPTEGFVLNSGIRLMFGGGEQH